jgi:hypothetical protein
MKTSRIQAIALASIFTALCALFILTACGGGSVESLSGEYVVIESDVDDRPVGSVVSFSDGVATNMWPLGKRAESRYTTMEMQDGFTAMIFEPYTGIENFTYYLKKDGRSIEVWNSIQHSLRDREAGYSYSFVIEKQ